MGEKTANILISVQWCDVGHRYGAGSLGGYVRMRAFTLQLITLLSWKDHRDENVTGRMFFLSFINYKTPRSLWGMNLQYNLLICLLIQQIFFVPSMYKHSAR